MKFLAVAAAMLLAGCAYQGDTVHASTVGQVKYVGGTGLAYARSNPQINQSSVRAGEEYLAQQQANDPIARDQARVMKKQRELDATYEQRKVAQKCQLIVEMHGTALYQAMYNNPTEQTISAFNDFRDKGQYAAFNRCMEKYKEAK